MELYSGVWSILSRASNIIIWVLEFVFCWFIIFAERIYQGYLFGVFGGRIGLALDGYLELCIRGI